MVNDRLTGRPPFARPSGRRRLLHHPANRPSGPCGFGSALSPGQCRRPVERVSPQSARDRNPGERAPRMPLQGDMRRECRRNEHADPGVTRRSARRAGFLPAYRTLQTEADPPPGSMLVLTGDICAPGSARPDILREPFRWEHRLARSAHWFRPRSGAAESHRAGRGAPRDRVCRRPVQSGARRCSRRRADGRALAPLVPSPPLIAARARPSGSSVESRRPDRPKPASI
jgi:hypothetical protein